MIITKGIRFIGIFNRYVCSPEPPVFILLTAVDDPRDELRTCQLRCAKGAAAARRAARAPNASARRPTRAAPPDSVGAIVRELDASSLKMVPIPPHASSIIDDEVMRWWDQ